VAAPRPEAPPVMTAETDASASALISGDLKLAGRLDERFFRLLQAIADTGSINRAARTAGYSYRGAWLLLETAANLATTPLVTTATGGSGGGGTQLTAAAQGLLAAWQQLHTRHQRFLSEQEAWLLSQPQLANALKRMSLKTTARNQFAGTVSAVDVGPVSTQVTLALAGGQEITATLTTSAAKRLKLKKGTEAIALIKSSAVVLVSDFGGLRTVGPQPAGRHHLARGPWRGDVDGGRDAARRRGDHGIGHQRRRQRAGAGGGAGHHGGVQGLCGDAGGGPAMSARIAARCWPCAPAPPTPTT
jgi:molybdate transport system regulatory protein